METIHRNHIKAVRYTMNYKDYQENPYYTWDNAIWVLINAKNSWGHNVLKLDVLQGGNDGTGFYPNYIELIVYRMNGGIEWDDYLTSLGYGFKKSKINVLQLIVEWEEGVDEVIAEID